MTVRPPARTAAAAAMKQFASTTEKVRITGVTQRVEYSNTIGIQYQVDSKMLDVTISDNVVSNFKEHGCIITTISLLFDDKTRNYGHQVLLKRNDVENLENTQTEIISLIDPDADNEENTNPNIFAAIVLTAAKTGAFNSLASQNRTLVTIVPRYAVIQRRATNELEALDKELKEYIADGNRDLFCVTYSKSRILDTIIGSKIIDSIKQAKKDTQLKTNLYSALKNVQSFDKNTKAAVNSFDAKKPEFDPFIAICARLFALILVDLSLSVVVVATTDSKTHTLLHYVEKYAKNIDERKQAITQLIANNTSTPLVDVVPKKNAILDGLRTIQNKESLYDFVKTYLTQTTVMLNSILKKNDSINFISEPIYNNIPFGFDPNVPVDASHTIINFNKITPVVTDMTHETPQTATTRRFAVHTSRTSIHDNERSTYATKINIHYTEATNEVVVTISDNVKSIFQKHGCALASIWVTSKDGTPHNYSHRVLFVRGDKTAKVVYQTPFSQTTQNEIISVIDSDAQANKKVSQIYEEIILSAAKTGAFDILSKTNQSVTIVPHYSVIQRRATIELNNLSKELLNTISDSKIHRTADTFCVTYAYIKLLDILADTDVIGAIKDAKKDTVLKQKFYTDLKRSKSDIVPESLDATNSEHDPFLAICARVFAHFLIGLSSVVVQSDKPMPNLDEGFQEYVATGKSRELMIPDDVQEFTKIKNKNGVTAFLLKKLTSVQNLTQHIFSKEGIVNHISNEAYNNIPFGFDPDEIVNATQTTINFNKLTPVLTDMTHETTLTKLLNNKSIYAFVYEPGTAAAPPP